MPTKLYVRGDLTNAKFYVGEPYTFRYQPTVPLLRKTTSSGGDIAVTSGRLQLKTLRFNFSRTGSFDLSVTPLGRAAKVTPFQSKRTQVIGGRPGRVIISEGGMRVLAPGNTRAQTIEITNSSFLPCFFTSADWEGFYVNRAQQI